MTKILLVEDDKSLREIYGVRLLAEGYDIVSAGDGEEALAMAIKERPQLIVSDVMMPKISGFDMLDILRSTTETKDIKVIMMTALSSEDQRQRGESLGADRYLVKSQVGIEDVVRTVHEVLGDAPTSPSAASKTFTSSPNARPATASPQPAPATGAGPQPMSAPQAPAAPQPGSPAQPQQMPSPTPAPNPAPTAPPVPSPAPTPTQPATSQLPQPTAPFSTNRPAGLGDRIIHPIEQPKEQRDFSNLMAEELSSEAPSANSQPFGQTTQSPSPASPPAVAPTPAPQQPPSAMPTPSPSPQPTAPAAPTPTASAPAPATPPPAQPSPSPINPQPMPAPQQPTPAPKISFEEIPMAPNHTPPSSPTPPQPPQQ